MYEYNILVLITNSLQLICEHLGHLGTHHQQTESSSEQLVPPQKIYPAFPKQGHPARQLQQKNVGLIVLCISFLCDENCTQDVPETPTQYL